MFIGDLEMVVALYKSARAEQTTFTDLIADAAAKKPWVAVVEPRF